MARKEIVRRIALGEGNRDNGKMFLITEMPCPRAEKWALRAFLAMSRSGVEIPQNVRGLGIVGVMILGFNVFLKGNIQFAELEPLADEMMDCVQIIRDPAHPKVATKLVSDDDIEEIATRMWLRQEVLELHTNFSLSEAWSRLMTEIKDQTALPST